MIGPVRPFATASPTVSRLGGGTAEVARWGAELSLRTTFILLLTGTSRRWCNTTRLRCDTLVLTIAKTVLSKLLFLIHDSSPEAQAFNGCFSLADAGRAVSSAADAHFCSAARDATHVVVRSRVTTMPVESMLCIRGAAMRRNRRRPWHSILAPAAGATVPDDDFLSDSVSLTKAQFRRMYTIGLAAGCAAAAVIGIRCVLACRFGAGVGTPISSSAHPLGARLRCVAHACVSDLTMQSGECSGAAAAAITPFASFGPAWAAAASCSSLLHDVLDSALAVASAVGTTVYTPLGHLFPSVQRSCVVAATSC